MNPTTDQILETLKDWKETLVDSYTVRVGKQKGTLPPKVKREIACIDAAACHVVASSAGWTSVTASLPDADTEVVVYTGQGNYWLASFDGTFWTEASDSEHVINSVTHWRHLPEPPTQTT
ncbi:MAG TPA: DUF551 domain-containing protein [Verrucomicrobiae bacterium]